MNPTKLGLAALLAAAGTFLGCGDEAKPTAAEATPRPKTVVDAKPPVMKAVAPKVLDVAGAKLTEKELKAIDGLKADDDKKLALEQKLCPVNGGHLGAMGAPYKVTLNGKTVFLCCDGCEDQAKAEPDATLAKLGK